MKNCFSTLFFLACFYFTNAQSYEFSETTGTYANLEGSLILENADFDNDNFNNLDLTGETMAFFGLDFNFGGITTYAIQPLGNVRVDNDSSAVLLDALRAISLYPIDETSKLSYLIDGEPGALIVKVEWQNMTLTDEAVNNFVNFQIWVYQETGVIEFRYGPRSKSNFSLESPVYVGLLYAPDDFFGVYEKIWISGEIGDLVIDTAPINVYEPIAGVPEEGTIYRFTPTFPLATSEGADHELNFNLVPNPTNHRVRIMGVGQRINSILVYDNKGSEVMHVKNADQLHTEHLEPGVYFVTVETSDGTATKRLVVSH
jgi:hypothetical protein